MKNNKKIARKNKKKRIRNISRKPEVVAFKKK